MAPTASRSRRKHTLTHRVLPSNSSSSLLRGPTTNIHLKVHHRIIRLPRATRPRECMRTKARLPSHPLSLHTRTLRQRGPRRGRRPVGDVAGLRKTKKRATDCPRPGWVRPRRSLEGDPRPSSRAGAVPVVWVFRPSLRARARETRPCPSSLLRTSLSLDKTDDLPFSACRAVVRRPPTKASLPARRRRSSRRNRREDRSSSRESSRS